MEELDFTAGKATGKQIVVAGMALMRKVREQVATSGAYRAARNLRKQGYALELALALIAGRF